MKILLFTLHYPTKTTPHAGSFNVSRVRALERQGIKVKVVNIHNPCPPLMHLFPIPQFNKIISHLFSELKLKQQESYNNLQFNWIPFPRAVNWFWQLYMLHFFIGRRIRKVVLDFEPNLILISEAHPYGTYSKYFKRYFNGPIYLISEGSDLLKMPLKYKGINKIINIINHYCDNLILVSDFQKQLLLSKYSLKNVRIINNGYEDALFDYQRRVIKSFHKKEILKIVSVGNLYPVKGHDILLRAVTELDIEFELTIIGNGYKKNEYSKFIEENGLNKKVRIVPAMPQNVLIDFLLNADICCMPSRSEGFSVAGLEALGTGLPLIATNVGGFPEIIIEGVNGYLVPIDDAFSLKNAIKKAAITNWDRKQIADSTKRNYSWDKWAMNLLCLYNNKAKYFA